jgi:hypothetical protein
VAAAYKPLVTVALVVLAEAEAEVEAQLFPPTAAA